MSPLTSNTHSTSITLTSSTAAWDTVTTIRPKRAARSAKRVEICTANIAAWASLPPPRAPTMRNVTVGISALFAELKLISPAGSCLGSTAELSGMTSILSKLTPRLHRQHHHKSKSKKLSAIGRNHPSVRTAPSVAISRWRKICVSEIHWSGWADLRLGRGRP